MEEQLRAMNQRLDAFMLQQDAHNQAYNRKLETHDKGLEEANRRHEQIMKKLNSMALNQRRPEVIHQQSPNDDRSTAELGNNFSPKPLNFTPKIEFPKFNGTNTRDWIMKCGKYFEICKIPDNQRFKIAVSHMIDKAEVWVNSYLSAKRTVFWYEFIYDLKERFRDDDSGTVVKQFDKLQQVDDLGVNGNNVHLVFDEVTDPLLGNEVDEFVVNKMRVDAVWEGIDNKMDVRNTKKRFESFVPVPDTLLQKMRQEKDIVTALDPKSKAAGGTETPWAQTTDVYAVGQLEEYDGNKLISAATEGLKLDDENEEENKKIEEEKKSFENFCTTVKNIQLMRFADYFGRTFSAVSESQFVGALTYNYGVDKYDMGTSFGHIAIATPDVYKFVDNARAKGGNVSREPGPVKGGSIIIVFVKDTDGYVFEIIQIASTPEPLCQVMLRVGDLDRYIKLNENALEMFVLIFDPGGGTLDASFLTICNAAMGRPVLHLRLPFNLCYAYVNFIYPYHATQVLAILNHSKLKGKCMRTRVRVSAVVIMKDVAENQNAEIFSANMLLGPLVPVYCGL